MSTQPARQVVVGATFTAEPIEPALRYWNELLGWNAELTFAPYNQLFQNVLDPGAPMRRNRDGANLVLVRLSDWAAEETSDPEAALKGRADEWVDAVGSVSGGAPYVVLFCPPRPEDDAALMERVQAHMRQRLAALGHVQVIGSDELWARYPVTAWSDPHADELGHIPYTESMFTALGTAAARRLDRLWRPAYKVLALDCDETLWTGVVGEDGPSGIGLTEERLALQRFALAQREAGVVLCLCSKNELADVERVLDEREDMLLKRDHLTLLKVNWESKSDNLRAIAEELNLGLDSVVFLDDNPVEIGEVRARTPQVLALKLPSGERLSELPRWLDHLWALDTLEVTEADRRRAEMYAENLARESAAKQAPSLKAFLDSLELDIQVSPVTAADVPRAAQLTQRTNQFNFTTLRRDEAAMQALVDDPAHEVLQVRVKDRFGDYGVVGLAIGEALPEAKLLRVDTLLMSCRALGRGVEYALLARLAELAAQRGLQNLRLDHVRTAKNLPALKFLRSVAGDTLVKDGDQHSAVLPSADLRGLQYDPDNQDAHDEAEPSSRVAGSSAGIDASEAAERYTKIASELHDPERIQEQLGPRQGAARGTAPSSEHVPPEGDLEPAVAEAVAEVLNVDVDRVGATDDFFAIGGNSLLATRVLSRLREDFEVNLTLKEFFAGPSVRALASTIEDMILKEIEALEDE